MYFCKVSECNYKTPWPANLRRHAAVHEKQRTGGNGCSLCLYKTARHNNVLRHLRLVHGGKGFVVKPPKKKKAQSQTTLAEDQAKNWVLDPSQEQEVEFEVYEEQDFDEVEKLEEYVCEYFPNPIKRIIPVDDVIIWPEAQHQEATFYKRRKCPSTGNPTMRQVIDASDDVR